MRKLGLLAALCCALASTGVATGVEVVRQYPSAEKYAEEGGEAGFLYYFHEAARLKAIGRRDSAQMYLRKCDSINPKNAQTHAEMAKIYFEQNDATRAEYEIERAVDLDSTNINNLEMQARIELANRNYTASAAALERIIRQKPSLVNYYAPLAAIYTETGKADDALMVWSKFEKISGYNPEITYSKFALWVNHLHNKEKALEEYEKAIEAQPYSTEYVIEKAKAQRLLGDEKGAEETLRRGTPKTKGNSAYTLALALLYNERGDVKSLGKIIDKVIGDSGIEYEEKESLLKSIMEKETTSKVATEKRMKTLVSLYPNEYTSYLFYAQALGLAGKDNAAMDMLHKSLERNPDQEGTWKIILGVYESKNDSVMMERILPEALEAFPESAEFHYLYGVVLYANKGDAKRAAEELDLAGDLMKTSDVFKAAEAKGDAADLYCMAGDTAKGLMKYDEAVTLNPNNAGVLNNYAYTLALGGTDLAKAERMSAKSVLLSPNNASYLDTFAWIYFLEGNYTAALLYIEQAARNAMGESAELSEHYGDILYKNGEKEKAQKLWNKAVELSGGKASESLRRKAEKGMME